MVVKDRSIFASRQRSKIKPIMFKPEKHQQYEKETLSGEETHSTCSLSPVSLHLICLPIKALLHSSSPWSGVNTIVHSYLLGYSRYIEIGYFPISCQLLIFDVVWRADRNGIGDINYQLLFLL